MSGTPTWPTYESVQHEMEASARRLALPFNLDLDGVRREKIRSVEALTGRPLIVYAADTVNTEKFKSNPALGMINPTDKDAFSEGIAGVAGNTVDILVQSGGGFADSAEAIVDLIRSRFSSVRFLIPHTAKSAGTMLAMSGDELVLGPTSDLGPTDPQLLLSTGHVSPAQAILDQFAQADQEILADPRRAAVWFPVLGGWGPSLIAECRNHIKLAEELVARWLRTYMFAGDSDANAHSDRVSRDLANHRMWATHARHIGIDWLRDVAKLRITDVRSDPMLDAAIWGLHIAISLQFNFSFATKFVDTSSGRAFFEKAPLEIEKLVASPATNAKGTRSNAGKAQSTHTNQKKKPQRPRGRHLSH